MPIDSSIPLSVNQIKVPDAMDSYGKMLTIKDMMMKNQMMQQQVQSENALRQLYSDPSNFTTQNGVPTLNPQAINKVMAIDPATGMNMQKQQLDMREKMGQMDKTQLETAQIKNKALSDSMAGVLDVTKQNPQAFMPAYQQAVNDLLQNGTIEQSHALQMLSNPSPEAVQRMAASSENHYKMLTHEHENRMADIAQQHLGLESQGMGERSRHDKAMEAAAGGVGFSGKPSELLASLASQGVSLPTGFRSKQQQLALLNGLINKYPDKSTDQIATGIKSGQLDMKSSVKEAQIVAGISGKVTYAEEGIKQTIPLVQQASDAIPRGEFVPLNKLMQMSEESISNPALRSLKIKINTLLNDYDVLAGRGGTDMAKREEVRKLLMSADSPEVLKSALAAFQQESDAAGRAAAAAKKRTTQVVNMDQQDQNSQESAPGNVSIDYTK